METHEFYRRKQLWERESVNAHEFRELADAARKISGKLQNRVKVEVTTAGDREPLESLLRGVKGNLAAALERLRNVDQLSLRNLSRCCLEGKEFLISAYGLSPGQKATAILKLPLLHSDAPLVVDQPEDDLDNRFITDGIVPIMRRHERRRQLESSTHNVNIPVLGDAELILVLAASSEAREGHARIGPEHMGSIDSKQVRVLMEETLEGGRNALEMRRSKYGS